MGHWHGDPIPVATLGLVKVLGGAFGADDYCVGVFQQQVDKILVDLASLEKNMSITIVTPTRSPLADSVAHLSPHRARAQQGDRDSEAAGGIGTGRPGDRVHRRGG